MHAQEILFEPLDAQGQREAGTEPVLLRARKELLDPDSKWFECLSSGLDGGGMGPLADFGCAMCVGYCTRTSSPRAYGCTPRRRSGRGRRARSTVTR